MADLFDGAPPGLAATLTGLVLFHASRPADLPRGCAVRRRSARSGCWVCKGSHPHYHSVAGWPLAQAEQIANFFLLFLNVQGTRVSAYDAPPVWGRIFEVI